MKTSKASPKKTLSLPVSVRKMAELITHNAGEKMRQIDADLLELQDEVKSLKKMGKPKAAVMLQEKLSEDKKKRKVFLVDGWKDEADMQISLLGRTTEPATARIAQDLAKFITTPLAQEVVTGLELVSKRLKAFEKKMEDNERGMVPRGKNAWDLAELDQKGIDVMRAVLTCEFVVKLADDVRDLVSSKTRTRIPTKTVYPFEAKREALASSCGRTAKGEISQFLGGFEGEMDMLSMFVADALRHYKLGVALLDGNPSKIDDAYSMDTASRENLTNEVWTFVNTKLDYKRVSATPKR